MKFSMLKDFRGGGGVTKFSGGGGEKFSGGLRNFGRGGYIFFRGRGGRGGEKFQGG